MTPDEQDVSYPLSRCISCCCCMEACPQFNEKTGFVGAATISQVRLFNSHPTGKALQNERLTALMGETAAFRSAATRRTVWKSAQSRSR
jgi:succinate dehydrogenase / fumarate reductase iron-sulfur subunit